MRYWLLIFLFIITYSNLALCSQYTSYEFVPTNHASLLKITESISFLNLTPLNGNHDGEASLFGANQIYVNKDFSSIVSFKFDVKGDIVLNQWENLSSGKVYHYRSENKINAIFVHGISKENASTLIEKLKKIVIVSTIFKSILIEKVQANECESSLQPKIEYPVFEKISSSVIFESLMACGTGAKTGAYDSTVGVAQMAWHGLESVGGEAAELWTNPKQKMDQYYNGIVKGSLAVKDLFTFAADMLVNPDKAKAVLKQKYGESADKVISIFNHIKNLPAPIMMEMSCAIITGVGIDVLVTYLTAGAGSEKLAYTFLRLSEKFETIGKVFKALDNVYEKGKGLVSLSKVKIEILTRKILQNKIPEEDLEYLKNLLGKSKSTDSTTIEALSCYIK